MMLNALAGQNPQPGFKGSGLASGREEDLDRQLAGQVSTRAQESAGAAGQQAVRGGAVAPLRPDAVLALQSIDKAGEKPPQPPPGSPKKSGQSNDPGAVKNESGRAGAAGSGNAGNAESSKKEDPDKDGLTEEEEKQVKELKDRDREVRAHEQAHARVGGPYASAPTYTFQQGPDGGRYAIGGEVQIDTSSENTPEATARKMQIVIRAALAPADPSPQDLKVAAQARATMAAAQAEARKESAEELQGSDETEETSGIDGVDGAGDSENAGSDGENSGKENGTEAIAAEAGSGRTFEPTGVSRTDENALTGEAEPETDGTGASQQSEDVRQAYEAAASRLVEATVRAANGFFGQGVVA